jgi:hypothetical protein
MATVTTGVADHGVLTGDELSDSPTLSQSLSAQGVGEAALLRSSTAAWANAVSDDVNFDFDPISLQQCVTEAFKVNPDQDRFNETLSKLLAALEVMDINRDGRLDGDEIINVVRDVYDTLDGSPLNDPVTSNCSPRWHFGLI